MKTLTTIPLALLGLVVILTLISVLWPLAPFIGWAMWAERKHEMRNSPPKKPAKD